MKILVCGGRDYNNYDVVESILNTILEKENVTHVIHGAAVGADTLAGRWAREKGIQEVRCPANWDVHGKRAGFLRNQAMLSLNPSMVVAFPGGKGTKMMADIAEKAGIITVDIVEESE